MINSIKFLRNISDYYIKNRNRYFIAENHLPDNTIVYAKDKFFYCPESLVVYKLWENHCTARYIRHEISDFVNLIKDRKSLLDIGASSGMFSSIFAAEKSAYSILSAEPDNISYDLLLKTIELNNKGNNSWLPSKCVVSNYDGSAKFNDGLFGGVVGAEGNTKECFKMESLCKANNFTPNVIKLDIESYEYEVITDSIDFLNKIDTNIQIEIHNELIRKRGLEPWKIYDLLREAGFRGVGKEGGLNKTQLKKEISHMHLIK